MEITGSGSLWFLIFSWVGLTGAAQEAADTTLTVTTAEVEIVGRGPGAPTAKSDGSYSIGSGMLDLTARAFGEADLLRVINLMPGVNTTSDYASGSSIDGADYSQNIYRLNGVPVLFPYHVGGIFSTFNATLFPRAELQKSIHRADAPSVLGGVVDMSSARRVEHTAVEGNVGLTAASVSVKTPIGQRLELSAGARLSCITLLYGGLMGGSQTDVTYDFADADFVATYRFNSRSDLTLTGHYNNDWMNYADDNYSMDTRMRWHNAAGGLAYSRRGTNLRQTHRGRISYLHNTMGLDMTGGPSAHIPSETLKAAVEGEGEFDASARVKVSVGYEVELSRYRSQSAQMSGIGADIDNLAPLHTSTLERIYGQARWKMPGALTLTGQLVGAAYQGPEGYSRVDVDPRLTLGRRVGKVDLTLHAGRYHQYYHYVGLSEIGLSSNFMLAARTTLPAQRAWNFAASANWEAPEGLPDIEVEAYYKTIANQAEYLGSILDMLDNGYVAENFINVTAGYNVGANLMVSRSFGAVTGWVTYGYNIARRHFAGEKEWFTASGDIRHAFSATANWHINSHWDVNATFNLASGRPFTPVDYIYIIGERLMMQYGERNSARFPLYHRLDLGATYRFRTGRHTRLEHLIGLSVLNAYCHENVEIQSYAVNTQTGRYYLRQISSLYRILPSINYTIKFHVR